MLMSAAAEQLGLAAVDPDRPATVRGSAAARDRAALAAESLRIAFRHGEAGRRRESAHRDLDQARTLITALAGLVKASAPDLGPHAAAFRDGLAGLQGAFREYSIHPDEPGSGPGE